MKTEKIDRTALVAEWRRAYEAVNRKPAPSIRYESGWFVVGVSCSKFRAKKLAEMTETLRKRSDDQLG